MSHETIYAAIYAQPRGGLKAAMIEALRQAKPKRGLADVEAGRTVSHEAAMASLRKIIDAKGPCGHSEQR